VYLCPVDCLQPYKFHKIDANIATTLSLTKDDAVKYYTQMKIIRTMETAAGNLYKEKAIRGFCHLYSGQVCHSHFVLHLLCIYSFVFLSVITVYFNAKDHYTSYQSYLHTAVSKCTHKKAKCESWAKSLHITTGW